MNSERKHVKAIVVIDGKNACFQPEPSKEVARILKATARAIERGIPNCNERKLYDQYGNAVGVLAYHVKKEN